MHRYSWRKRDLNRLAKELEEMNFQPEIERKLSGIKTIKLSVYHLTVKSDNLKGSFYELEGFLSFYGKDENLSPNDLRLIEIYKRNYRFPIPRELAIAPIPVIIGILLVLLT